MNPFNQTRFRGEHELGRAYMDIRRALDNLEVIKFVADNIRNFRSGNIELSAEGSVLKWKYVAGEEWFNLVDLVVINGHLEEAVDLINGTLQNLNNQLDNFNGIVSNQGSQLSTLTQRVEDVEEFESRIALTESAISTINGTLQDLDDTVSTQGSDLISITQRVGAVEAFEGRIAQLESSVSSLVSRVEALENPGGGE